jgi:signal transduction histidine kinase/ActR/RegA family two-component response regulator
MNEPAPPTGATGAESVENALYLVRARVLLVTLNVLAVAMPLVCVVFAWQAYQAGSLNPPTLALCSFSLVFPLLRVVYAKVAFRTAAISLLVVLLVSAAMVASRGGFTAGSLSVSVLLIMLAALFFGRLGAATALVAVVLIMAGTGVLVVQGYIPPMSRELWDPAIGGVWMRQTLLMALLGIVLAATELYVVERLARQVEVHQNLAAREREQRLALERAERERAQAERALEQSRRIEALARMAGGVAHDFNNALTVIVGGAEMARLHSSSPADVEQCLDEVLRAANSAAELSRRLMLLGRQHIAKPRPTSIVDLLDRLKTPIRRILPDDVQIVLNAPDQDAIAFVDDAELERALLNLALNARDAMPRGGRLTIAWRIVDASGAPDLADGRYVSISVTDTGQGMDRETLDRIFDPFFTTRSDKGGTGLGLATVYAFTKESRGAVSATSTPGHGTTITLNLPEAVAVHPKAASLATEPEQPETLAAARGERVLVVEDRPDVRASMARILSHHGFSVSETHDGESALRMLSRRKDFALMCIDGVMPGLETATVIERAKQLAPSMPVLVCSGHVQEDLLRRGIATGRYAFLAKPFSAQQLLISVTQLLDSRGDDTMTRPPSPA